MDAYLKIVEFWHTDSAYRAIPSLGAVLRALAVPDEGGETLFANLFRAWEEMPEALRRRVEGRIGRFSYERIRDFADPAPAANVFARDALVDCLRPLRSRA